jgi:hypothetical protein
MLTLPINSFLHCHKLSLKICMRIAAMTHTEIERGVHYFTGYTVAKSTRRSLCDDT